MLHVAKGYVTVVDRINYRIGRVMMYGIFVMIGILLWSSISKTFFLPSLWTLEMAQFAMVAYYIMGGPYSMQLGSNVRMDLFYGEWSDRTKAWVDSLHGPVPDLLPGRAAVWRHRQHALRDRSTGNAATTAWRPYMWPIKVICAPAFS